MPFLVFELELCPPASCDASFLALETYKLSRDKTYCVQRPGESDVRKVLSDVVAPNRGTFLSFGIVGTLWSALTFLLGALLLIALAVMVVGPHFGELLTGRVHLSKAWVWVWPYVHWTSSIVFTVAAVESLYFLAPNVKQRFFATLPGANILIQGP